MKVEVFLYGKPEEIEATRDKEKIYGKPYRYIATDFEQSVDVYEHRRTGEFIGLMN